jgi:hypothetical protein
MPWPIPSAKTIAARIAASLETAILRIRPDIDPRAVSRAVRSDHGVHAQIGSAVSAEIRTVHDHQSWWGRQYMPDSADDEAMILRHANIWGTGQRQAIAAIGTVLIEGTAGEPLPAGIELAASNAVLYTTTATATIGIGGSVSVAAIANVAGSAGNLASGVQLATVVAYPRDLQGHGGRRVRGWGGCADARRNQGGLSATYPPAGPWRCRVRLSGLGRRSCIRQGGCP